MSAALAATVPNAKNPIAAICNIFFMTAPDYPITWRAG
jgi:hypothetical protein